MKVEFDLYAQLMKDYDKKYDYSGVNGDRIAKRLDAISDIGMTDDNGSYRLGYSKEEKQAKALVKGWMKGAGLAITEDGAGNVFGRLEGRTNHLPAIVSGSHVDSVPNGGHFDGPLGVISSLEVIEAWKETGYTPNRPYEVAIFTDEEGTRFNSGLSGSRAAAGEVDFDRQMKLKDGEGKSFAEVLGEIGLTMDDYISTARNLNEIACYVEVHIEQGRILEKANLPTGVVSGIAGPSWLEVEFTGKAGHAGNTPMTERKDALVVAGQLIRNIHDFPRQVSSTAVATVGKLHVHPNGANVIPGKVELIVDIRDINEETRDQLVGMVQSEAEKVSAEFGLTCEVNQTLKIKPVTIEQELQDKLVAATEKHGIAPKFLSSGAGHDAMTFGHHLPVAMLFVNSKDGVSHNPEEWSSLNDCIQTIHVLKSFVECLE